LLGIVLENWRETKQDQESHTSKVVHIFLVIKWVKNEKRSLTQPDCSRLPIDLTIGSPCTPGAPS
jgi:hypothetical protein